MPDSTEPVLIRADFNEIDGNAVLHVIRRQAERPDDLALGGVVRLADADGSSMLGVVTGIDRDLIEIQTIWESWRDPDGQPADDAYGTVSWQPRASTEQGTWAVNVYISFPSRPSQDLSLPTRQGTRDFYYVTSSPSTAEAGT